MALINESEFFYNFFNGRHYTGDARTWPKSTILLCCCFAEYVTRTNGNPKHKVLTRSKMGHIWMRFDNRQQQHAEKNMIDYLERSISDFAGHDVQKVWVFVVLSYSPCKTCADELIKFRKALKNKDIKLILRIKFANFYKCYANNNSNALKSLYSLIKHKIRLDVFQNRDWQWLLRYVLGLPETFHVEDIDRTKMFERKEREEVDVSILRGLYFCLLHLREFKDDLYRIARSTSAVAAHEALRELERLESCESSESSSESSPESVTSGESRETWRVSGNKYRVPWPETPMTRIRPEE